MPNGPVGWPGMRSKTDELPLRKAMLKYASPMPWKRSTMMATGVNLVGNRMYVDAYVNVYATYTHTHTHTHTHTVRDGG